MPFLANPEDAWSSQVPALARSDVEDRIGPTSEQLEVLSGGLANLNIRVGSERVLRIHRRDPESTALEHTLLTKAWRSFVVPKVHAAGGDFLLLGWLPLDRVPDDAVHGAIVGTALAEIHAMRYSSAGFLGADLSVRAPVSNPLALLADYARSELARFDPSASTPSVERLLAYFDTALDDLASAVPQAVLLHADFKAANLHLTDYGRLCVLDWEFAYAGPPLMDVGQLLRYSPCAGFVAAFANAYRGAGGVLPRSFERLAPRFDLFNLAGLLGGSQPATRRANDVQALILSTLDAQ